MSEILINIKTIQHHLNSNMVKIVLLTVFSLIATLVSVQAAPAGTNGFGDHWICSCFRPDYDYGCCAEVNGSLDGNVCDISNAGNSTKYLDYEACCTKLNGTHKCK
ncbi:hypothetical protein BGW37DRAFT_515057 [Umbelopsis sp. PMI_123]|nr:hypothetical protein BGW37DRAFT_515057 [Umbelopsis sp. PMI_123]